MFIEGWNSIRDQNGSGKPTIASTIEMVDSVNALILAKIRVRIEDIYGKQGIYVGTAHEIIHDCFSVISSVIVEFYQASYCSKNNENHPSLW